VRKLLNLNTFLILILTIFVNIQKGTSQIGAEFSYWTFFDDNTFQNWEQLSDIIYQPDFTIFYDHKEGNNQTRFFYQGSFFIFNQFTNRQYQYHRIGVSGSRVISKNNLLLWGIRGGKRYNTTDYEYYDYSRLQSYFNVRLKSTFPQLWILGMQAQYRSYTILPQFSFLETKGFIRTNMFLKTKTSIITNFSVGYKRFTEAMINSSVIEEEIIRGGHGKWGGNGNPPPVDSIRSNIVVYSQSSYDNILQLRGSLRIAQSLGNKAGLAVEGTIQRNPQGSSRILSGQDSGYETNDALFDDPYSYESEGIISELTLLLPYGYKFKIGGETKSKRYDRPVYDSDGNPVEDTFRNDTRDLIWVYLNKSLLFKKGPFSSLSIFVSLSYINNKSNDDYYNYTNEITSFGIDFSL